MTRVAAEGESAPRRAWPAPSPWLIVSILFAVSAGLLFVYNGLRYANETQSELRLIPYLRYDLREDFNYFYSGADMAWHGEASDLYPYKFEWTFYPRDPVFFEGHDDYANSRLIARGNYYNPPALAFLQSPLTTLPFREAFWLFSLGALGCLLGFLTLAWRSGREIPELPLLIAGVLALKPLHEALILGHTTIYFILILTAGFLLLRAEKPVLTGVCFSLLALKPQWAILPALFLLVRGEGKALGVMATGASAIFFIPFLFLGFDTFERYVDFLRFSADIDMLDAPHMFSWNGFLSKWDGSEVQDGQVVLFADAPSKVLIYGLITLTAVPLLVILWGRDYLLGVAATVVAMLLVSTHSVWYDWALLSVAALFLVLRSREMRRSQRVEMWVVLLALTIAASQSVAEVLKPNRHDVDWHRSAFYSLTPVAFASLLWMASLAVRDGLPPLSSIRPPWRSR